MADRLLIIADDLTGACETAVHFAEEGIYTQILTVIPDQIDQQYDCEVLVVNTESRHDPPEDAKRKILKSIPAKKAFDFTHIYKKSDSVLRGNIGAELEMLMDIGKNKRLHFIPAHPAIGRFTRNGHHYLGNIPINESEFAFDPLNPVLESDIKEVLRKQTDVSTLLCIPGQDYMGFAGIVIHDISNMEDLKNLVNRLNDNNELMLCAGSGGFVSLLPEILNFSSHSVKSENRKLPDSILTVNGSLHPVALRQVTEGLRSGIEGLRISSDDLTTGRLPKRKQLNTILYSVLDVSESRSYSYSGVKYVESFAQIVAGIWNQEPESILCVFGGDTLISILKLLNVRVLTPHMEILPGMVLCSFYHNGSERFLISKPGSFGEIDILTKLNRTIKEKWL